MEEIEFKDQYKHPKWQLKRLRKIESTIGVCGAEVPCCEWCQCSDIELHVHHIRYFKGRKIWEYSDYELLVLCKNCHVETHKLMDEINHSLVSITYCFPDNLSELNKLLKQLTNATPPDITDLIKFQTEVLNVHDNLKK